MEEPITFKSILKEKEFWLLCALGVLCFPGVLIGETFFYRDLYLHYLTQKKLLSQIILNGELPLWNPYLHGGQPFLAEIDFSVLYPSNILYLVLPLYTAFNIDIVGHVILGAAGAYCLARFMRLSPLSSAVCGAVFAFCGFSLSILNLMNRMLAHPYLPCMCALWHGFLMKKKPYLFLLSALFSTFQIFAGAPEWTAITFLLLLIWSFSFPYQIPLTKRILWLLVLGVSAILLSAVQLIPTYEMTEVSSRAIAGSFDIFAQWSIRPERILEVLFPNFLGRPDTLAAADYWGTKIEDFGFPYILSLYFGLPVLILVIAGIQRNRLHLALLIAAVVAILFSLGRFFPITRVLYEFVPGISHFRYPVKFFCLALVPISYLAAAGFEKHWVDKTSLTKSYILTALWLATAVMILFFLLLNVQNFMDSFVRSFFKLPLTAQMHAGLMNSVFHVAIISFLLSLVYTLHKFRMAQWHRFVIFGILAVDLMIAGKNLNPLAPVSFYETPEAVHLVRKELRGGKFYRTPNPPGIVLNAPSNDVIWQYRWNLEVLSEHLGTSYAIPMIFHGDIDGLAQKRLIDLTTVLNQLPWQKRLPILSAAGVTVIMTHEKLNVPGVQPAYVLRNRSNVPFFIYRNRGAIVPAARVQNLVKIKGLQGTINFLISPDFTPDRCAVTDEDFNKPFGCLEKGGSVKFLRSSYRQMEYQTSGNCKDVLALNLPFYKGWQVFIDGNESKLFSINWAFSGIQVPANSHQLLLRYSPNSVKIGAIITLVSITVLLIFTVTINYAVRKA